MPLNKRHESIEDYLETILELSKVNPIVRSIDIAQAMNYSKPSISIAMKKLKERHYIIIDDNGYITLTEMGLTVAKSVLEKHEIISKVLIKMEPLIGPIQILLFWIIIVISTLMFYTNKHTA